MRWRKLGLIYGPRGDRAWARSHAIAPTPILMADGTLRVYFATCDDAMIGRIGFVDLDPYDPTRVIREAERPALDIGDSGCFDDNGVSVTSLVSVDDELRMYYFGYQLSSTVRYLLFGGLAISRDGGHSFVRHSHVPIIERRDGERFVRSAPFTLADKNGGFRMWYVSGDEHVTVNGKIVPRYGVRHLASDDGLAWCGIGQVVLAPRGEDEYGFGRPYVVADGDGLRMWYSLRSKSRGYRIGAAVSDDGLVWTRQDDASGIDVSPSGWDMQSICYPSVISCVGRTYMLYNGNGYGRDGFGAAVLTEC